MAKRSQDLAAAKAKKQKIILIVGGVLLLGVAAFQGPKLMKGSGSTAAPEPSPACAGSGSAVTPARRWPRQRRRTRLGHGGGVVLPKATVVKVAPEPARVLHALRGQGSRSCRRSATTAPAPARVPGRPLRRQTPPRAMRRQPAVTPPPRGGTATPAAPPPPPYAFATINFDGKAQQLQAKDQFPTAAPLFVIRSVKKSRSRSALPAAPSTTTRPSRSSWARR